MNLHPMGLHQPRYRSARSHGILACSGPRRNATSWAFNELFFAALERLADQVSD
jgi:hypothetical protein